MLIEEKPTYIYRQPLFHKPDEGDIFIINSRFHDIISLDTKIEKNRTGFVTKQKNNCSPFEPIVMLYPTTFKALQRALNKENPTYTHTLFYFVEDENHEEYSSNHMPIAFNKNDDINFLHNEHLQLLCFLENPSSISYTFQGNDKLMASSLPQNQYYAIAFFLYDNSIYTAGPYYNITQFNKDFINKSYLYSINNSIDVYATT